MKTIMTAGKGGTGKSVTLAHLLKRSLLPAMQGSVLVVDADPHQSLTQMLSVLYGFQAPISLGELRREHESALRSGKGLEEASREELAELLVRKALVSLPGGALLVMGENDQPGCQCVVNSLLGRALDALREQYDLAVVDNEAGIEHIGRHHGWAVDTLLLFATMRPSDLDVAARILRKAEAVGREIKQTVLVVNQYRGGMTLEETERILPDVWLTLPYSASLEQSGQADEDWLSGLKVLWDFMQ